MPANELKKRRNALPRLSAFGIGGFRHPAFLGRPVQYREIELIVTGVERGEQVEYGVQHMVGPGVSLVDLVDDHDRFQSQRECLGEHELGLGHRALGRIDQQDRAIDHVEDALDLAAEIRVAGRVDDVDPDVVPDQRRDLGQNGDPAFALQIVGIKGALHKLSARANRPGGGEQDIDQGGLSMIDMSDDRNIAQGFVQCLGRLDMLRCDITLFLAGEQPVGGNGGRSAGPVRMVSHTTQMRPIAFTNDSRCRCAATRIGRCLDRCFAATSGDENVRTRCCH